MKILSLVPTILGLFISISTWANAIPQSSLPMTTLIKKLESNGYVFIHEIEFSDDTFKVEAVNKQGENVELTMNPETGEILTNHEHEKSNMKLTMMDAVQAVENAGYHNIYKITVSLSKSNYEIKALDKNGGRISLNINGVTGEISKE